MQFRSILLFFMLFYVFLTPAKAERYGFQLPEGYVHIYFESFFSQLAKQKLLRWLEESSLAITTLYGVFPVKQTHVYLYAKTRANEPVPWGEVWKNGQYRVNFHVNPHYSQKSFLNDWTAVHEFSHLIHPYPGKGNAWFGEGLASYYQNILRVRQGLMTEEQAWQKLADGFQRGEKVAARNKMSLQEASWNMHNTASYGHVYWGGAAYFLAVDIRLRQYSQGLQSLDSAWFQFRQCCLSYKNHWQVEDIIQKLDQLTGTTVFTDEYTNVLGSLLFPDYRQSLHQIGVHIMKNGKVQLNQSLLRASIITVNKYNHPYF